MEFECPLVVLTNSLSRTDPTHRQVNPAHTLATYLNTKMTAFWILRSAVSQNLTNDSEVIRAVLKAVIFILVVTRTLNLNQAGIRKLQACPALKITTCHTASLRVKDKRCSLTLSVLCSAHFILNGS